MLAFTRPSDLKRGGRGSQASKLVFTRPSDLKRGGKEAKLVTGNTKEGSISVPLTTCLTGLESAV